MARSWQELFATGEGARGGRRARRGGAPRLLPPPAREHAKTREALGAELQATLFQSLDDEACERLEETLIYADVGAPTTARIVERLEGEADGGELSGGEDLTRGCASCSPKPPGRRRHDPAVRHPTVILMVGVNGTGKTTTIGKLAWHLQKELGQVGAAGRGRHVPRRGGRAARLWAERAGCEIVRGEPGPTRARSSSTPSPPREARGHDVVIIDTAGRLHTQKNLMDELRKVRSVIAQPAPGRAPRDAAHDRRDHRARTACARRCCSRRPWT